MMQEDGQEMLEGNRITVVTVDPDSGSTTHIQGKITTWALGLFLMNSLRALLRLVKPVQFILYKLDFDSI